MKSVHLFFWAICFLLLGCSSGTDSTYPAGLSPKKSLEQFYLKEGFNIALFAHEPAVIDPVEMIFDTQGRAYVLEMRDFPFRSRNDQALGQIKLLEDTNQDGKIDKSTVFASGLNQATSILAWKDGILVCAAPHILYLRDSDGNGKADKREILLTGFFAQNLEVNISGLRYGLDNWIYVANNGQNGVITSPIHPDHPEVNVLGADFRFNMEPFAFEAIAGRAQSGLDEDNWGNWLFTQDTYHAQHQVIPRHYLIQNPTLGKVEAIRPTYQDGTYMYPLGEVPLWRKVRSERRQAEFDEKGFKRKEHASHHFTACTGSTFYLAHTFPAKYYGSLFTGDVSGNLVHRDIVEPLKDMPSFATYRADDEQSREFLATRDTWFRPVNFRVGPDGSLYVLDMYRQHIELPARIPKDLQEDMDFEAGNEQGRIYRISPAGPVAASAQGWQAFEQGGTALLPLLAHRNRWHRMKAQQKLVETPDRELLKPLNEMVLEHPNPLGRLHAMYSLDGMRMLDPRILERSLKDPHPEVRKHAIKLGERYWAVRKHLPDMLEDSIQQVALQAILSLGTSQQISYKSYYLAQAARTWYADRWFRLAILAGLHNGETARVLLDRLSRRRDDFFADSLEVKLEFREAIQNLIPAGGRR